MTNSKRRKLSEEEFVENDNNADKDEDFESTSGSRTIQVPLAAVRHQIEKILEFFIIIQFTVGAFIFFTGIFLLSWAVTPGTAFKAASYMLLAGFIIGRSLLGLVGLHPGRSGALFAYGSILMFTCILRTIMILVCMKILMGSESFIVPALLTAAPGALSPSIELICAIIEGTQALCAFYVAWMIDKQTDAERDFNDQQLEIVLINLRAMQQRRHFSGFNRKSQASNPSAKNYSGINSNKHENNHHNGLQQSQQQQQQQSTQAEIDYFAVYKRYPRNTPTPTVSKSPKPQIEHENEPTEVEQTVEDNENEQEFDDKIEDEQKITNKRQLPVRPYTLDYAPVNNHPNGQLEQQNNQLEQTNHYSQHSQQQQHLQQPEPFPVMSQKHAQHYYPQYHETYSYYDTVPKTPPEHEIDPQFEPYSQANSPLLLDRRYYYGATASRAANEFEYRAFNGHYP